MQNTFAVLCVKVEKDKVTKPACCYSSIVRCWDGVKLQVSCNKDSYLLTVYFPTFGNYSLVLLSIIHCQVQKKNNWWSQVLGHNSSSIKLDPETHQNAASLNNIYWSIVFINRTILIWFYIVYLTYFQTIPNHIAFCFFLFLFLSDLRMSWADLKYWYWAQSRHIWTDKYWLYEA